LVTRLLLVDSISSSPFASCEGSKNRAEPFFCKLARSVFRRTLSYASISETVAPNEPIYTRSHRSSQGIRDYVIELERDQKGRRSCAFVRFNLFHPLPQPPRTFQQTYRLILEGHCESPLYPRSSPTRSTFFLWR